MMDDNTNADDLSSPRQGESSGSLDDDKEEEEEEEEEDVEDKEEDIDSGRYDFFPVPPDSYGDVIISIIAAADGSPSVASMRRLWLGASFVMYMLMFAMQLALSFAILATSIEQSKQHFEAGGAEEMIESLHAAVRGRTPLPKENLARKICDGMDVAITPMYLFIIIIWFTNMMDKVTEATWLLIATQRVAVHRSREDTEPWTNTWSGPTGGALALASGDRWKGGNRYHAAHCQLEGGQVDTCIHSFQRGGLWFYQVRSMTDRLQFICMLVALSKLVAVLWIAWVGINFLVFVNETKVLVLKALVCNFFVNVGENSFTWLASEQKKKYVASSSFCYRRIKTDDWSFYGSTWIRAGVVISSASTTWFCIFHSVRGFRYACLDYKSAFPDWF